MSNGEKTQDSQVDPAGGGNPDRETGRRRRGWLRFGLLLLGPLAVALGGAWIYMNSGRLVETDNAYVKATSAVIGTEVAGLIADVGVEENQTVHEGDVLFRIDDAEYRVAVERAESQLDTVRALIAGIQASYQRGLEELSLARTNVAYAERELAREESLASRQLGSESDLDAARHDLDVARQQIPIIEQSLAQLRAQLGGRVELDVENHAGFRAAKSMLENAVLNLSHTTVRAPFDGVAIRVPTAGTYVARGGPVMGMISSADIWIEANYKETELTHVEVGQSSVVHIDSYPDLEWRGRVASISPATGSEFSVIPVQNASGNWVKVAQRIPVRIAIDLRPGDPPLRAGMSAVVEIDSRYERRAPAYLGFLNLLKR